MGVGNGCVTSLNQHTKKCAVAVHVIVRDYQMTIPALILAKSRHIILWPQDSVFVSLSNYLACF